MPARALLLLLVCVCARGGLLTAKELICKDPDTGTLHAINSTWRSSTFCGNYTCKLRSASTATGSDDSARTSKIIVNLSRPQALNDTTVNNNENFAHEFTLSKILPDHSKDNDRFLNRAEIQKITNLLHTVKKSDLQDVIELYNVAQEIYKGMKVDMNDIKGADEEHNDSNERTRAIESKPEDFRRSVNSKVSYWYEPVNGYRKVGDMTTEGSEYKPTTTYVVTKPYEPPYFYASRNSHYPSYFSGTLLSKNDFGRLGYYHPQANFQSLPSYYQQRNINDASGSTPNTPCSPCPRAYHYQTPMLENSGPINYAPSRSPVNILMQPYLSSPYNYSTHAYSQYNNYYKGNPLAYYDYFRNLPYQTATHVQNRPIVVNAEILTNTGEHLKLDSAENENIKKEKEKSWKTDPLSEVVINEIRANIAERGKLLNIPLKKRIKLERAAKVIKLDHVNTRKTRSVTVSTKVDGEESPLEDNNRNAEEVETYLEKTTCEPTLEPGFFRIGNMARPYPECCPQKINKDKRLSLFPQV